jgi:[acyl-carrier-protein] S-malonyltransferase
MPFAVLFPGQASQTPDMRDDVQARRPDLLELVTDVVGEDPFPRADEDTRFAQPAIFCASLAGWSAVDGTPAAVAGHSLGEISALAAVGAIAEADALRLVALRGRLMSGREEGTMLAVLGGDPDVVGEVADRRGVTVANDNAPGQLVLSGARQPIDSAAAELRAAGTRVMELNVAGAFHSPLMEGAVPELRAALDEIEVRETQITVWSCITAVPIDDVRRRIADGLTHPVRWRETVLNLHGIGIDRFEEAGPGRVLTKMLKRTLPEVARV